MTPDFRALAEKIVRESYVELLLPGVAKVFDYHKCTRDIESALRQVYEQRPKCDCCKEYPVNFSYKTEDGKAVVMTTYSNTKIKDAEK